MNPIFDNHRILLLDGAMGTMLQKSGLKLGERPDLLSITQPDLVKAVHQAYISAGSDFISTNTFGANAKKLAGCGFSVTQVVDAGVQIAKNASLGKNVRVVLDIGPIGELLEPVGALKFEEAYEIFREVIVAGANAGADLILFETMTDLYELKAGILAAQENSSLPILASMTFESNGRTFTGCTVESLALLSQSLCIDGVGINCSLGPTEIYPLAQRLCNSTSLPVFVKPNAGLPDPASGIYHTSPSQFCQQLLPYCELGISAIGGCCGTDPEYIRLLAKSFQNKSPYPRTPKLYSAVCTPTNTVIIDQVRVIGERINPTGKKRFKEALKSQDMNYILTQAAEQASAGADILDINVGLPGIDEQEMMVRTVKAVQSICDLPLQLDSTRPDVLEAGLRIYNGKPIVNSVNAEQAVLDKLLPICKKYGAAVVGLTLDENGIPPLAEERFRLAEKIVLAAEKIGIPRNDVFIDCLTLTASAQQDAVVETLKAVQLVKQRLGVKTVLGVSNISFGLPCREYLNTSFLTLALAHGLDLPIMNPNTESMMAAVASYRVLYHLDLDSKEYLARYSNRSAVSLPISDSELSLFDAVLKGLKIPAANAAKVQLETQQPEEIINSTLIPALDEVGTRFEKGTLFLPQLLQSASAAQSAFDVVKEALMSSGKQSSGKGTIILATVKGDIHDIGKNIVKTLLDNYGYNVIDLGRDVPPLKVVRAAKEHSAPLVGLSALMTTTLASMEETIHELHAAHVNCKIMVGGAVLTSEYAAEIGADYYAKDAKQSVDIARQVFGIS